MGNGNPFSVITANDFSDQEIRDFWVDLDNSGFAKLFAPRERGPKLIIGGKGSGKTHLMRYFSFALQRIRAGPDSVIQRVRDDGYLGIYLRCGGLDGGRFASKSQPKDSWSTLFSYYMDLRLAYHIIDLAVSLGTPNELAIEGSEAGVCLDIINLFDRFDGPQPTTLLGLRDTFRLLQTEVDFAVNNAATTRRLDVPVRCTPGRLVFGIPAILERSCRVLSGLSFLYLIDQLEDLTEAQQRYVHTLVRERAAPVSFRIGARTYGIRTYATLAAGEENRPGSEFDLIQLDEHLRKGTAQYSTFARRLVHSRLRQAGFEVPSDRLESRDLDEFFEGGSRELATRFVGARSGERVYFKQLRTQLQDGMRRGIAFGVANEIQVASVLSALQCSDEPILEKLNALLLYRSWSRHGNLVEAAREIGAQCQAFRIDRKQPSEYADTHDHYAADMFFQLCRDYEQKGRYLYPGFESFVKLSDGFPRNLVVILKNIFKWAEFGGEKPFEGAPISLRAQERGVFEASEWFFREAPRSGGKAALDARNAVGRLGELFRELVYAEKPPECSLSTFSAPVDGLSEHLQRGFEAAENFSLLVRITTNQKDRNSDRIDSKFQLNRMLLPRWGLPLGRRGAISLNADEVSAIFDVGQEAPFSAVKQARTERARFPFGLLAKRGQQNEELFPKASHD